jgi:hypothetical protein
LPGARPAFTLECTDPPEVSADGTVLEFLAVHVSSGSPVVALRGIRGVAGFIGVLALGIAGTWVAAREPESVDVRQPPVVIAGVAVFDSLGGAMLADRTVVIEGERIVAVGTPEQPADVPEGSVTIDGSGKFLLPGLIDAHVHLVHVLNLGHVTGDEVLPLFLAAGVTAVRDTGDEIVAETVVRRFAESHPGRSPRVFACSPLIDAEPPIHRDIGRAVTDPDQVPALVDEMAAWGVTTLKIYAGTGRPVGRRVIEEGHRRGMVVTAHLGPYSAQDAVSDGIDCLEHIWSVFNYIIPPDVAAQPGHRATLDLHNPLAGALVVDLAQRGVMVDPTLTVFRNMILLSDQPEVTEHPDNLLAPARLRTAWKDYLKRLGLPAGEAEPRRQEFAKYQELTGILHRAGVPILAGTDTPEPYITPGFALHQELARLVESGLPPAAALQAATINNARALKQEANLGSVEPGKLADLVLLDADPLADIGHTRRIRLVVRGGHICDPAELLRLVPRE